MKNSSCSPTSSIFFTIPNLLSDLIAEIFSIIQIMNRSAVFYFLLEENSNPTINANRTAEAIPAAAAVIPPVNTPRKPVSVTAFRIPFANRWPNPVRGTVAPAPANSTNFSYSPNAERITPATT